MITIDEMAEMLDEVAEEFPREFYKELNGGVVLLSGVKKNPAGEAGDLFIMAEYNRGGALGRYIAVYYGSFMRVYGHLSRERMKAQLRETLSHEFTHHVESLAGERGLEVEDERQIEEYKRRRGRRPK
jgi:hypothetical protein